MNKELKNLALQKVETEKQIAFFKKELNELETKLQQGEISVKKLIILAIFAFSDSERCH